MKTIKKLVRATIWLLVVPGCTLAAIIAFVMLFAIGEICHICGWHNNPIIRLTFDMFGDFDPIPFKTYINMN